MAARPGRNMKPLPLKPTWIRDEDQFEASNVTAAARELRIAQDAVYYESEEDRLSPLPSYTPYLEGYLMRLAILEVPLSPSIRKSIPPRYDPYRGELPPAPKRPLRRITVELPIIPPVPQPRHPNDRRAKARKSAKLLRIMGFLKHFRSRSKLKNERDDGHADEHLQSMPYNSNSLSPYYMPHAPGGQDTIQKLPPPVLQRIFGFVCPHTEDSSFDLCEHVILPDDCMLCSLKTLAGCARVRQSWYEPAQRQLYRAIRIDPVHYCPRELELKDMRDKRLRRSKNRSRSGPSDDYVYDYRSDPAVDRISMLTECLTKKPALGQLVNSIKLPYMVRETRKGDVARLLRECPNLMYIDLPPSFYEGDPGCDIIRQELLANCPDLRMMKYCKGSEAHFQQFGQHNPWSHLQNVTIENIRIDLALLRKALSGLPYLNTLVLKHLRDVPDDLFTLAQHVPEFPPLVNLELHDLPRVTATGLIKYLQRPHTSNNLVSLTLDNTGVNVTNLPHVLEAAWKLRSLTFVKEVEVSLPLEMPPLLTSNSLRTLHFEIIDMSEETVPPPSESYYNYLRTSLLASRLPRLGALYCRDPDMPALLAAATHAHALPVPQPAFLEGAAPRHIPRQPFTQPLEIYTRAQHEGEWRFKQINNDLSDFGSDPDRPSSSFNALWGGNARKSVIIPDGDHGLLNVPGEEYVRPGSSHSSRSPNLRSSSFGGGGMQSGFLSPDDVQGASAGGPAGNHHRQSWWSQHAGVGKRGSRADMWR